MMRRHVARALALVAALLLLTSADADAQAAGKAAADAKGLRPPARAWAAQVSATDFTLVWRGVPAATGYEVLVRDPKGQLVRLGVLSASGSRYTVPLARLSRMGIALDRVQFAVRALNGTTQGPVTMFNQVSRAPQGAAAAVAAPGSVAARETAPGVVTVTWDEVAGATAYGIGRAIGNYGFQRFCDLCPTGGVLVDTVPTAGTRYVYSVTAFTAAGRSRGATSPPVQVTGLATQGGGAVAAGSEPKADPKALANAIQVTPRASGVGNFGTIFTFIVQIANNVAGPTGGVVGQLLRKVCDGPWMVVRAVSLDQRVLDVEDAVDGIDAQCGTGKRTVRYQVSVPNPKGLAEKSPTGEIEVAGAGAPATGASTADPKGLAAGITVTPRVSGGGMLGAIGRIVVSITRQVGAQVGAQVGTQVAHLMRQVCDGPWTVVRAVSLAQSAVDVEDTVGDIDAQCGSGKRAIRYQVRISDPKGLVANSSAGEVEVTSHAPEATEPPATPGNRGYARTSGGRRTLTWSAVPGATGYRIERLAGAKGAWTVVKELPGDATTWVDTATVDGTPKYRITAMNRAGNSATGNFP